MGCAAVALAGDPRQCSRTAVICSWGELLLAGDPGRSSRAADDLLSLGGCAYAFCERACRRHRAQKSREDAIFGGLHGRGSVFYLLLRQGPQKRIVERYLASLSEVSMRVMCQNRALSIHVFTVILCSLFIVTL